MMKKYIYKTSLFFLLSFMSFQTFAQEEISTFGESTFIAPDDIKIRYNGVLYSVITNTQAKLYRYSEDYLLNGMDGTINKLKARTQPGVSVSFKTNSPLVKLKFDRLEDSAEGKYIRFSVFKDGELCHDYITDFEFILANPAKDTVMWEVYLPYFAGTKFLGLELSTDYALYPLPSEEKPLYMSIGNSITHGVGQTGTIDTYPYHVANALGFRLINLATGGSRISAETIRNFKDVSPRLVTILWGVNDVNQSKPLSEVMPGYRELVDGLCSKLPDADIYCILQTFSTLEVGRRNEKNTVENLRGLTKELVKELQEKYDNLYLLDGWDYVSSQEGLKDRVHLNVKGASDLAEGIVSDYNQSQSLKTFKNE